MRIHFFQHVPYEGTGCIDSWIKRRGYTLSITKFFENYSLPDISHIDWLIIMGGPMGIYDEDRFPWLKEEKLFIQKAIALNKVVLGICLGSQLIADSMGAKVKRNAYKEIGWFPVKSIKEKMKNNTFDFFADQQIVMHWHGDTFEIPHNTEHLLESDGCKNQAFIYKQNVIGLQFHMEFTDDSFKELIKRGRKELVKSKFVQSEEEILNKLYLLNENNRLMFQLLDKIDSKH